MPDIRLILHPTDFSENSLPAFQAACSLARDSDASLLVLHVMMPSASPLMQGPPPDPFRAFESQGSHAQLPWPQTSDPRIRVEHRLAEGEPAEEILRVCEALHSDIIVMGTHGKTGLARLLTGSVAQEVLRKGTCPVLVVRTPLHATHEAEVLAHPGDLIDVRPLGASLVSAHPRTMVRTTAVEVVRLIVLTGQEIHQSQSEGEIIVHCLEGRVALTALGKTQTLEAGKLLILPAREPSGFKGIEDASLLLTILVPKR
jgi:nucleotide-binding universal stress UspA family protein/quercetin dioxygenase-like cupin family protein